jgi:hypothetical protein
MGRIQKQNVPGVPPPSPKRCLTLRYLESRSRIKDSVDLIELYPGCPKHLWKSRPKKHGLRIFRSLPPPHQGNSTELGLAMWGKFLLQPNSFLSGKTQKRLHPERSGSKPPTCTEPPTEHNIRPVSIHHHYQAVHRRQNLHSTGVAKTPRREAIECGQRGTNFNTGTPGILHTRRMGQRVQAVDLPESRDTRPIQVRMSSEAYVFDRHFQNDTYKVMVPGAAPFHWDKGLPRGSRFLEISATASTIFLLFRILRRSPFPKL